MATRPWPEPIKLPYVPQQIGCEHPTPVNVTTLDGVADRYVCPRCGVEWHDASTFYLRFRRW